MTRMRPIYKQATEKLVLSSLLSATGMCRIIVKTRKCLNNGARRGHAPRRNELKVVVQGRTEYGVEDAKAREGLFQHLR